MNHNQLQSGLKKLAESTIDRVFSWSYSKSKVSIKWCNLKIHTYFAK